MTQKILATILLAAGLAGAAHASCRGAENVAVPITTPTSDFDVHGDGTVTHRVTGLMWMRCAYGQTLVGNACTGQFVGKPWSEALATAAQETFAGHSDWRLPNVKELLSIVEERCQQMAFNVDVFPFAEPLAFWSSTPDNNDVSDFSNYSLMVANGAIWNETRTVALPVLMVRGGQP